jgi:PAS domain S-box-containing protein
VADSAEDELRALREQNRRLVALIDSIPDFLSLHDLKGEVVFVNRPAARHLERTMGVPPQQVVGMSLQQIGFTPDFCALIESFIARAVAGEDVSADLELPAPGGYIWLDTKMSPVYDERGKIETVAIASRDVHHRKLSELRTRLLSKLGALGGAVDEAAVLAALGQVAVPELGDACMVAPIDHVTAAGPLLVSECTPESLRAHIRDPELRARLERPETRSLLIMPLVIAGAPAALLICAFTGLNLRRYGAEELALGEELLGRAAQLIENARLNRQLEKAVVFREQLMAILAHDLRNPLSAIRGLARLILWQKETPDETRKHLTLIDQSARRMVEMIGTLLDVAESRFKGSLTIRPRPMDIAETSTSVIEELRAARPNHAIELDAASKILGVWDEARMAQVVSNLVGNALAHGDAAHPVRVTIARDNDVVVLAVSNRGPTIPPELLPMLFEPFRRGESTTRERGLGLGLYIVAQIVGAHSGTIAVTSTDGLTTFSVRLPSNLSPAPQL